MVNIYVTADEKGYVTGYGRGEYGVITTDPKDSHKVEIPEDHEILQGNISGYKLIRNVLVKDTTIILKGAKEQKIKLLSYACQEAILGRFPSTHQGTDYTFSYDKEAQLNFAERWNLFQNNLITSIMLTAKTTPGEEVKRIQVSKDEFTVIYLDSIKHKENCISRLQDLLIPMVNNAVSTKQLEDINWTNISLIPGEPSLVVKDDLTLAKGVEKAEAKASLAKDSSELTTMAFMEAMGVLFGQ